LASIGQFMSSAAQVGANRANLLRKILEVWCENLPGACSMLWRCKSEILISVAKTPHLWAREQVI
jgi:hypothetical protein